jgi:hypothetical protein
VARSGASCTSSFRPAAAAPLRFLVAHSTNPGQGYCVSLPVRIIDGEGSPRAAAAAYRMESVAGHGRSGMALSPEDDREGPSQNSGASPLKSSPLERRRESTGVESGSIYIWRVLSTLALASRARVPLCETFHVPSFPPSLQSDNSCSQSPSLHVLLVSESSAAPTATAACLVC